MTTGLDAFGASLTYLGPICGQAAEIRLLELGLVRVDVRWFLDALRVI